jgi:type IV pilus assembly protein PilW
MKRVKMNLKMEFETGLNRRGVTLIELMVALVISAIVIAGIYKVFIAQTKSYYVQDQVMEVQQNTRSAMETLLRDLRMTGFDDDNAKSLITIPTPITAAGDNSITVNYEYYDRDDSTYKKHTVAYWREDGNATVFRQLSVDDVPNVSEALLENVDELTFSYGIDQNDDGIVDNWVPAAGVGSIKVIAVRVTLVARPDQTNEDVRKIVSPRALDSIVSIRNLCLR